MQTRGDSSKLESDWPEKVLVISNPWAAAAQLEVSSVLLVPVVCERCGDGDEDLVGVIKAASDRPQGPRSGSTWQCETMSLNCRCVGCIAAGVGIAGRVLVEISGELMGPG